MAYETAEPAPIIEYPLWLAPDTDWATVGVRNRGGSFAAGAYASVESGDRGRGYYNLFQNTAPAVITLLGKLGYGFSLNSRGQELTLAAKELITNSQEVKQRRQARLQVSQLRRQLVAAETRWEALKGVRAQKLNMGLMRALADDVATWPEVIEASVEGDHLEITFWPVFFDDVHGLTGLSTPMTFNVSAGGDVTYQGGYHPHAYEGETVCPGEARFGGGIAIALGDLRNWWVGTDGSPANSGWLDDSVGWWAEHHNWRTESSKYLVAPAYEEDEATIHELTRNKLESLLEASRPAYDFCERCDTEVPQRNGDSELYNCYTCERSICERCYYGDDRCLDCEQERADAEVAEEEEDEEDEDTDLDSHWPQGYIEGVTTDDYEPTPPTNYYCEFPAYDVEYHGGAVCHATALWQRKDRYNNQNQFPNYVCQEHYGWLSPPSDPTVSTAWHRFAPNELSQRWSQCSVTYTSCVATPEYRAVGTGQRCSQHVPRQRDARGFEGLSIAEGWVNPQASLALAVSDFVATFEEETNASN